MTTAHLHFFATHPWHQALAWGAILFVCFVHIGAFAAPQSSDEFRLMIRPLKILELPVDYSSLDKLKLPVPLGKGNDALFPAVRFEIYGKDTQNDATARYAVRATGVTLEYLRDSLTKAKVGWEERPQANGSVLFLIADGDKDYSVSINPQTNEFLMVHRELNSKVENLFKNFLKDGFFPEEIALAGKIALPRSYRKAHPLLKNVETVDFYVMPGKNAAGEHRVTGKVSFYATSAEVNQSIFSETSQFFANVLTNAAKLGQLRPDHLEAFRVVMEDGKTTVVLSLSPQIAEDFITILSSQLKKSDSVL